ncbi:MAG: recombinase family protein [Candidatus Berkelbacteria bacterium]|nr:recombinase family protein [Candidatus Berkelbacteria bacterium]
MIKYFIYCRKSSEEEERQILSIEAQLQELRDYAKQNSLFVIKEFFESRTAKEPGRPIFNQMLSEIEKGNASGILAWNPDRLARNSIDGGKVIYLVDTAKITSLKFPTFWFDTTPQGKFMLSVAFGQAKYYTDNLRENILRGIRQKLRRGELPAKAPLGYYNEPRIRTIEPDKQTFKKMRQILEAFATGNFTLSQIRDKMFSLGLVGKNGEPLHLSTVQGLLKNPFYYGMFIYRGELMQGSHKPMISKKLFDKIQKAIVDNGKPRKKIIKKDLIFKNFAICGKCGYKVTGETHTKKSGLVFSYYRCTKKSKVKNCDEGFLREEKLAEQVQVICQKVSIPDEWKDKYLAKVEEWENEQNNSSGIFAQNLKDKLTKVKERTNRLIDLHLDGEIELDEFKHKKNMLVEQKADIEQKLNDFERKGNHWLELLKSWILDANQAGNLANTKNFFGMKNFLKTVGSNRILLDGKLQMNFEKQYTLLYNLPAEARAFGSREAASEQVNTLWWTQADSNR